MDSTVTALSFPGKILVLFQLHVMDSLVAELVDATMFAEIKNFQLHVMDSPIPVPLSFWEVLLSTPCNGFALKTLCGTGPLFHTQLSTPCNGFGDSSLCFRVSSQSFSLSTPCNGFCTMGALVLVYCFVIVGFYYVFYCCTSVFSALGPP